MRWEKFFACPRQDTLEPKGITSALRCGQGQDRQGPYRVSLPSPVSLNNLTKTSTQPACSGIGKLSDLVGKGREEEKEGDRGGLEETIT